MVYHDYIHEFIQSYITSAHSNGVKKLKPRTGAAGNSAALKLTVFHGHHWLVSQGAMMALFA